MTNKNHFLVKLRNLKVVVIAVTSVYLVIVFNSSTYSYNIEMNANVRKDMHIRIAIPKPPHDVIVDEFYQSRKSWNLSKLGDILYKNVRYSEIKKENRNKTFVILIWKFWERLQKRHVYYLGTEKHDPLDKCSVRNCEFTGDNDKLYTADAVLIHIFHAEGPSLENRNRNQIWIFLNDEAPRNVFKTHIQPPLSALYNVFNWSMTYLNDADIPVPSGRTVALKTPKFNFPNSPISHLIPYWRDKRRDVLISILMSNCGVLYRRKTIIGLKSYMTVDVYGKCGDAHLKKSCPEHFRLDCKEISQYLFYLALENSKCRGYFTEKIFYNAYTKGAIPVIQGPTVEECEQYLPPNSYLHLDNYANFKDLSDDIKRISEDEKELLRYHQWRNHFEVLNEHGYFGTRSFHLCRLCEAMNYNDKAESVYDERKINYFLNNSLSCRDAILKSFF